MSDFTADIYENAIAEAISRKDLKVAVALLRRMAVKHPYRAERLLDAVQSSLDEIDGGC